VPALLILAVALIFLPVAASGIVPWYVPLIALFGAAVFLIIQHKVFFDLMDEVWEDAAYLEFRRNGEQDRILVSNISEVKGTMMQNPDVISLSLNKPCRFGSEISFLPPHRFFRWTEHSIVRELRTKIAKA
jgi:hypothetical protein